MTMLILITKHMLLIAKINTERINNKAKHSQILNLTTNVPTAPAVESHSNGQREING